MNPQNCTGTVKTGLCPGGNDNKCCIMIVDNKNTVNKNTVNKNTGNKNTGNTKTTTEDTSSKDTTTKDTSNTNTDDSKQTTSSSSQNSGNQSQSEFIETIGNYAKEEASNRKKNGEHWILPSVCIAQAALETGWGKSTRMKEAKPISVLKQIVIGKERYIHPIPKNVMMELIRYKSKMPHSEPMILLKILFMTTLI